MAQTTPRRDLFALFFPLYLPGFLFAFSYSLLVPVLPIFAQSLTDSYALVGVVLAGESIGMLVGDVPAGMLMRRMGQKRSMMIGLGISGISTAGLFFAPNIVSVVLLRMVAGLGASLFSVSRHYFLTEMAPPASRGRIISIFGGLYRLGRLLGPVIGGTLAVTFSLRASFLVFAAICLVALVIVIFFLPTLEVERKDEVKMLLSPGSYFMQMLRSQFRVLSTAGVGYLFMQLLRSGPQVILPLYGANYLGMDVSMIGWVMSASAALDLAMFYPAGLMMDRWGRRYAIIPSSLGLALSLALVPLAHNWVTLLAVGMLGGLCGGLSSGAMLTTGADLAPRQGRSEFLGAWTLVGDIGATTGPLAVGGLAEVISLPLTGWVIACAGLGSALIFGFLVPETLKKEIRP